MLVALTNAFATAAAATANATATASSGCSDAATTATPSSEKVDTSRRLASALCGGLQPRDQVPNIEMDLPDLFLGDPQAEKPALKVTHRPKHDFDGESKKT